jgi:hypothetical protein
VSEGASRIADGIKDRRATGSILGMPFFLTLKPEALLLADRTPEALEAVSEAEVLVERFEDRHWCAEMHRRRGVLLSHLSADESQIEAWFQAAIRIAQEQKSSSLKKRAEEIYRVSYLQQNDPSVWVAN